MKSKTVIRSVTVGVIAVGATLGFATVATAAPPTPRPSPTATATASLDSEVAAELVYMREEERLSRDVYTAIAKLYPDATVFSTIAKSEQRHFDSVGVLLGRYGLDDPATQAKPGTYAEAELTELYAKLMATARTSVKDAYGVGVTIEEKDIADLKDVLKMSLPADVQQVMQNLLNGSEHHLAAFTSLEKTGTVAGRTGSGARNGANSPNNPGQGNGSQARQGQSNGSAEKGDGICNQS